jgi:hypothetical protein
MSHNRVETARDFKTIVVDADYDAYKADPLNLRLAYHLALSLFHLKDWTHLQYSNDPRWPLKKKKAYQKALEKRCPEFGYMRDLANAVRHAEITQDPSTAIGSLGATSLSQAAFSDAFQGEAFQNRTCIVSKTAPDEFADFEKAADAVMKMWNDLFSPEVAHE